MSDEESFERLEGLNTETRRHGENRHRAEEGGQADRSFPDPPSTLSVSPCLRVESEMASPADLSAVEAVEQLARRQEELIERELTVLQEQGGAVSCRAGCAACCRQFVVVSPLEAVAIGRHVRSAEDAQRQRWEAAHARHRAELPQWPSLVRRLGAFREAQGYLSPEEGDLLEREYWAAQIACPFLEEERCTIYPVRPFACREHFAVTPAALCATDLDAVQTPPTRFEFRAIASQVGERCFGLEDRLVPLFETLSSVDEEWEAAERVASASMVTRLVESVLARVLAWRARFTG
jgi:Fe-S-cluster containining protein